VAPHPGGRAERAVRVIGALTDLVLPTICAGCGITGHGDACRQCRDALAALVPSRTAPRPEPPGLPPCFALGAYEGPLRGLILAYKERGAHRLAGPLGRQLAGAVAAAASAPADSGFPRLDAVVLVPVPSTSAAIRERHGDHMSRLARHAVRQLRGTGRQAAVMAGLTAGARGDSSHLSAEARASSAVGAFRLRAGAAARIGAARKAGARVIVVDDILTTGSTLASIAQVLAGAGIPVDGAATIAATRRRSLSPNRVRPSGMRSDVGFSS
jgi:predicted amidophosphoribosyltransferase